MQEWELKERRNFVRFPVTISSKYSNLTGYVEDWGKTHDISVRGVCLAVSEEITPGSDVEICLVMPDNGERIEVKGTIKWHQVISPDTHRVGISLERNYLKPIPLVLRAMQV